jgi:DNA polymerase III delta subunit
MPSSFLFGPNRFLTQRRAEALKAEFLGRTPSGRVASFDAEDPGFRLEDFFLAGAPDLFAEKKLLFLYRPFSLSADLRERLIAFLDEEPGAEAVYVETGTAKKNERLFKALAKATRPEEVALPSVSEKRRALEERLRESGPESRISKDAEALFFERTENDPARFYTELEKLALYGTGRTLEEEDVLRLVPAPETDRVFEALEALAEGHSARAQALLEGAARQKRSVLPVFGLLSWQLRQFLSVRELADQGITNPGVLARRLKLSPFAVSKSLRVLKRFPLSRTEKALRRLSEYDRDINRGRLDEYAALDLFIWKL